MTARRTTASIASALLLAVPAPALAQSAGDDQYADPIEQPAPPSDTSGTSGGSGGSGGGDTGSGSGVAPSTPAQPSAPADPGAATAVTTAGGELPRTGADIALLCLVGAAFLLGGAGLRLALPSHA